MATSNIIDHSLKLLGESAFLPGFSQFVDGNIKAGTVYAVTGITARFILGAPVMALVAADSYSRSISGKSLCTNLFCREKEKPQAQEPVLPPQSTDTP